MSILYYDTGPVLDAFPDDRLAQDGDDSGYDGVAINLEDPQEQKHTRYTTPSHHGHSVASGKTGEL